MTHPVLDHGYVRYLDHMGDDRTIVNAARVSFQKESVEFTDADERLLVYLAKHGHTSPFRHGMLSFEVGAPLMVARQWWKYVVGSDHTMGAWNESSRRYVTETPEFYVVPEDGWRAAPASMKQGSGPPLPVEDGAVWTARLRARYEAGLEDYLDAVVAGVAVEQARLFLPANGLYVRWRWTASVEAVAHFLAQRLECDAQREIRLFAEAVDVEASRWFPWSFRALLGERSEAN